MHYTQVLKNQKDINAKILEIKKQIETKNKEATGEKE